MWILSFPDWVLNTANSSVLYGTKLMIHSTIIILIGLAASLLVRRIGPSAQSLVLRSFLLLTLIWIFLAPHINISSIKSIIIEIPKVSPSENKINIQKPLIFRDIKAVPSPVNSQPVAGKSIITNNVSTAQSNEKYNSENSEPLLIQKVNYLDIPLHSTPPETESGIDIKAVLYTLLMFIWFSLFLFFILRILFNVVYLYYLIKMSEPAGKQAVMKCVSAAKKMNLTPPLVLQNHQIKSPFIAGIVRPVIFMPSDETLYENTAYEIFLHELSHLKRHDNLWNFAQHFLKAVIPFQPLVWILSKWIEETSDYSCDDYVIKHTYNNKNYANGLFRIALYHNPIWREKVAGVGFLSFKSTLSKRITRIMDNSRIIRIENGKRIIAYVSCVCVFSIFVTGMFGVREKALAIMNQSLVIPVYKIVNNSHVYSLFRESEMVLKKNIAQKHSGNSLKPVINDLNDDINDGNNPDLKIDNKGNSKNNDFISGNIDVLSSINALYEPGINAVAVNSSALHDNEKMAESKPADTVRSDPKTSSDNQTGSYFGNTLFAGNTTLSVSGYKETKIRMPVAKALNVQVDFDYKNYDFNLNEKNDRELYNLYRNLDKNKNEPAWSPDGKWIAFTDHNRIWLVSSGGGEPEIIYEEDFKGYTIGNFESICFTPDSKEVTFKKDVYDESKGSTVSIKGISTPGEYVVLSNPVPNIESVNISTQEHHVVAEEGYGCTWSHSGRYLCYLNWALDTGPDAAKFGLPVILDKQTGEKHFLPVDNQKRYGVPSFSPDDKYISIPVRDKTGPIELYRIPLDGGQPEQLTVYNETDTHGKFRNFPEYSPDGNWILYTDFTWSGNKPDKRLFVYNMKTRNIYEVFEKAYYPNSYGRWSPDGTKICYLSEEGDGNYIYICDFYPETFKKPVNTETTKPFVFKLYGNYPNPFNASTTIEFSIPESGNVILDIYNMSGQKVVELINGQITSGKHTVVWNSCDRNGRHVASGIYISRLQLNSRFLTNRMTLLK